MTDQQELLLADRRQITRRASADTEFRTALKRDPHAAIAAETGVTLPDAMRVRVIEEAAGDHYAGVLPRPAALAEGLPPPERVRDVWDNLLLEAVAMKPAAKAALLADPVAFARDLAGDFPGDRLTVYEETADETVLVLDRPTEEDELDDTSLDLIAAGDAAGGGPGTGKS